MSERRVFTEEFKREAIHQAEERGNVAATIPDLSASQERPLRLDRSLVQPKAPTFSDPLHPSGSD